MQTVIIEGGVSGPSVVVPTPSELAVARAYPTDPNIKLGGTDENFDGYADILIVGLLSLNSSSYLYDCLILYASGESGVAQPMGHQFVDEEYVEFFGNIADAIADPQFYNNNTETILRKKYGVLIICPNQFFPWVFTSLWNCRIYVFDLGFDVQIVGIGYHVMAPSATNTIEAIVQNEDYLGGSDWWNLSQALKSVLGVNSFGFQDDGSRMQTNYGDGDTVESEFEEIAMWTRVFYAFQNMQYDPNVVVWWQHNYDVNANICSTTSQTSIVVNSFLSGQLTKSISPSVCTEENVMCWSKRRPAPRQNGSWATVGQDEPSILIFNNPIRTHVFDQENVLVNNTLPGHSLHDDLATNPECGHHANYDNIEDRCSYVHRDVETDLSGLWVTMETHGEGYNPTFSLKLWNELIGNYVFNGVDRWIQRRLADQGACTDD